MQCVFLKFRGTMGPKKLMHACFNLYEGKLSSIVNLLMFVPGRAKQFDLASAQRTVGTCPDMCPEKERYMREDRHQVGSYEQLQVRLCES